MSVSRISRYFVNLMDRAFDISQYFYHCLIWFGQWHLLYEEQKSVPKFRFHPKLQKNWKSKKFQQKISAKNSNDIWNIKIDNPFKMLTKSGLFFLFIFIDVTTFSIIRFSWYISKFLYKMFNFQLIKIMKFQIVNLFPFKFIEKQRSKTLEIWWKFQINNFFQIKISL